MEMMTRFIKDLEFNDRSDKTINAYKSDIYKLVEYINERLSGDLTLDECLTLIDYSVLEDFKYWLVIKGYARSSINRCIASLKKFFNYYDRHGGYDVAHKLKGYERVYSKKKRVLTSEEVAALISQTQTKRYGEKFVEFNSARDRLIISILATTGLRIEELLGLTFVDMEHYEDYIMINITCHEGTTKLNKRVPICGKTLTYYNEYMTEYEKKFDVTPESYLIVSPRSGKKIATKDSNTMIKKYSSELGIEGISNHCFRHFANIKLMAVGCPDSIRNKILGWSSSDMGSTVYFHNTEEIDRLMVEYVSRILL